MRIVPLPGDGRQKCEYALKCFFDLTEPELRIYRILLASGSRTARELGGIVSRNRSTAYRSVTDLVECGLVRKVTVTREGGGIYHRYEAVEPLEVQSVLEERIDDWYAAMKKVAGRTAQELSGG